MTINFKADDLSPAPLFGCYLYVLNLKGTYNGQKEITAVSRKTAASIASTTPSAPVTIPPKYR